MEKPSDLSVYTSKQGSISIFKTFGKLQLQTAAATGRTLLLLVHCMMRLEFCEIGFVYSEAETKL